MNTKCQQARRLPLARTRSHHGAARALLMLPAIVGSGLVLLIGLAWLRRYEILALTVWVLAGLLTMTERGERLLLRSHGIRSLNEAEISALAPAWNAALISCGVNPGRLDLRISDEESPNAHAAGDRCVAVTRGALTAYLTRNLSDNHLTAILAHEIGHHHTNGTRLPLVADYFALPWRRILRGATRLTNSLLPRQPQLPLQAMSVAAVALACSGCARGQHWAALIALSGGVSAAIICPIADAALARRSEFAADEVAAEAGLASELADALSLLDSGPVAPRLLSRHPSVYRRIERLEDSGILAANAGRSEHIW